MVKTTNQISWEYVLWDFFVEFFIENKQLKPHIDQELLLASSQRSISQTNAKKEKGVSNTAETMQLEFGAKNL